MSKIEVNAIEPQCGTNLTVGASGDTITFPSGTTVVNNGSQTGFGRTGTVDWQTGDIKTATFTATSGEGYFVNTTSGSVTVNLPAGVAGAIVGLKDYAGTWDSNAVTLNPNGSDKIGGGSDISVTLEVNGGAVLLVFVDSTQGWLTTQESVTESPSGAEKFICASVSGACNTLVTAPDCANVKIATFTGPGTFTVNGIATCATNNVLSYLIVGGGGSSNTQPSPAPGGGGAGGFREVVSPVAPYTASPFNGYPTPGNRITASVTTFPITVGAGGAPNGGASPSTFSTITSAGGGAGGGSPFASPTDAGQDGGSGGGGAGGPGGSGGSGNTPPTSPSQGFPGGNGDPSPPNSSGAGGGSGAAGGSGSAAKAGNAGPGEATNITSSPVIYAVGGAGAGFGPTANGDAATCGSAVNASGTANRGNGAGGNGANGGSGIVIIRYKFQ